MRQLFLCVNIIIIYSAKMNRLKKILRPIFSPLIRSLLPWRKQFKNFKILSSQYGQFKTIYDWNCVDAEGKEIPWYTYPATEFLKQLDFKNKTVFEYGSGNSTIFWSKRCKSILSVEDDKKWFDKIAKSLPENVDYRFTNDKDEYVNLPSFLDQKFDVIIVDGSYRSECASVAALHLKSDGFIILDNSDWYEATSSALREKDFIEIDMAGFGPINNYTWTTSIFLRRGVDLRPLADEQPKNSIGSLVNKELTRQE